jgi:hypothetical protein
MKREQVIMEWAYRGLRRYRPVLLPMLDALTWAVLLYVV